MLDENSKERLYREINAFHNIESILEILSSGADALESEETETAHAAKDDIVKQYIKSTEFYIESLIEEEAEYQASLPLKVKAVQKCQDLFHLGLSLIFRSHTDPNYNTNEYENIRHEQYTSSIFNYMMDRLESLSDVYETLMHIAHLNSQGKTDPLTAKILIEAEKNNVIPHLRSRIEADVTTLQTIINVPFDDEPTRKPTTVELDADDEYKNRSWILLALVNKSLTLTPENIKEELSLQKIKFTLPEQIKATMHNMHSELALVAGKYFYDKEYRPETPDILSPAVFNAKREALSETAKILYTLSDSILQDEINPKTKYNRENSPTVALKLH